MENRWLNRVHIWQQLNHVHQGPGSLKHFSDVRVFQVLSPRACTSFTNCQACKVFTKSRNMYHEILIQKVLMKFASIKHLHVYYIHWHHALLAPYRGSGTVPARKYPQGRMEGCEYMGHLCAVAMHLAYVQAMISLPVSLLSSVHLYPIAPSSSTPISLFLYITLYLYECIIPEWSS